MSLRRLNERRWLPTSFVYSAETVFSIPGVRILHRPAPEQYHPAPYIYSRSPYPYICWSMESCCSLMWTPRLCTLNFNSFSERDQKRIHQNFLSLTRCFGTDLISACHAIKTTNGSQRNDKLGSKRDNHGTSEQAK